MNRLSAVLGLAALFLISFSHPLRAAGRIPFAEELRASGHTLSRTTADNRFSEPLKDVLDDLQERFSVRFKYGKELVTGVEVDYAGFRICPWSLTQTLDNLLKPLDYKYEAVGDGLYEIKRFEYHRRSVADGQAWLDWLASLSPDLNAWEARRDTLRSELRQRAGLDKLPAWNGKQPYLTAKRVYDGYYVRNFALELLPGVYCTGSLYHPLKGRRLPVILNPNGHFGDGRYNRDVQTRCAMQARLGCIAVNYDLFAWGEQALQFEEASHRTAAAHTLQSLNSLRLLDWLLALKEADPSRVGITGGSGGGSATMFITAIDERITLSIPVVMTSAIHSGGCPCESGNPIHLSAGGTNNVEIASMCAPRPMLVVSDGKDWTANVPRLEFPFIRRVYELYGPEVSSQVENAHFATEGHDYGPSKRQAAYAFLIRQWKLKTDGLLLPDGSIDEQGCTIEQPEALKVWGPDGAGLPADALHGIAGLYELLNTYGL